MALFSSKNDRIIYVDIILLLKLGQNWKTEKEPEKFGTIFVGGQMRKTTTDKPRSLWESFSFQALGFIWKSVENEHSHTEHASGQKMHMNQRH